MPTKRKSLTLETEIIEQMEDISNRLCITQSSLINEILSTTIPELHKFVSIVVPEPTDKRPLSRKMAKTKLLELQSLIKQMVLDFDKNVEKI